MITTGADMSASEWDPETWTLSRVLRDHYGAVCAVSALGDGHIFCKVLSLVSEYSKGAWALTFFGTSARRVLTASLDGKLKVWKENVEKQKQNLLHRAPAVTAGGKGVRRRSPSLANRRG